MARKSPLSKRLKEARTKVGISQRRLGIAAGVDEFSASARINQYERGTHSPDYAMTERLAQVLGYPTPYFYSREDDLAELVVLFGRLPQKERKRVLSAFRKDLARSK